MSSAPSITAAAAAAAAAASPARGAGAPTAFIGAGGGGDTVCAALRALAHPAPHTCAVLGAGYAFEEYTGALEKGAPGDRLACDGARARAHVSAILRPAVLPAAAPPCPDVWRVAGLPDGALEAFAAPLVVREGPTWRGDARFKYKTLLEESTFATRLSAYASASAAAAHPADAAPAAEALAVHMFVSTPAAPGAPGGAFERMTAALRVFLSSHEPRLRRVVIVDCGGDILAPGRGGRDAAVLRACAALAPELGLTLRVEVYGAGGDAHADAATVEARMAAMRTHLLVASQARDDPASSEESTDEEDDGAPARFVALLEANASHGLATDVLGDGRAAGNFLAASRFLADVDGGRLSAQEAYDAYAQRCLRPRVEYARAPGGDAWRDAFDAANDAFGARAVLEAGARVHVFAAASEDALNALVGGGGGGGGGAAAEGK
jgi:hypothetical protein